MALTVTLKGYGNAPKEKKLKRTKRVVSEYSSKRFPGQVSDNWVTVTGHDFGSRLESLALEYRLNNGAVVTTTIIDSAVVTQAGVSTLHIWFAAFRNFRALPDGTLQDESPAAAEAGKSLGPLIGSITVTITTGGTSDYGSGDVDEED